MKVSQATVQNIARTPATTYLRERQAAEYVALSQFTLQKMRQTDAHRIDAGLEPRGPIWCRQGRVVYYRQDHLDEYMARARKPVVSL